LASRRHHPITLECPGSKIGVRTWGDGGLYDHVIDYDKKGKVTTVTNSLGHTTVYRMNAIGLVIKVVDPLGAATSYEYE